MIGLVGLEHPWEMFFWKVYECSFVFGWFSRKMEEIIKIWAVSGVLRYVVGIPTQQHRPTPRHGLSTPWRGRVGGKSSLGFAAT